MNNVTFVHEGNVGVLTVVTHFGKTHEIRCHKTDGEAFRVGGTAVTDVAVYEGLVLKFSKSLSVAPFRAYIRLDQPFEGVGVMSPEEWHEADLHCYVTEYYSLDFEGKSPGWLISHKPIRTANELFTNVDTVDGGGNVVKRYRVCMFFGDYRVLETV